MKLLAILLSTLLLGACATVSNPMPDGYSGPKTWITDNYDQEDGSKAKFFIVREVDCAFRRT
jgi:hypothetical protein